MSFARRAALVFTAIGSWAVGCGGKVEPVDLRPPTPPAWDRIIERPNAEDAAAARAVCGFGRGTLPAETLGADTPLDADIPIKKIVIVMMENRSFDHYFGELASFTGRSDIEVAPADATNPDHVGTIAGALHARRHAPHPCALDTEHSWAMSHVEWDNGKMDGFFAASANDPKVDSSMIDRPLWWYGAEDLPFYYSLASTFAIADHYHASVLGPTWPNRMYLLAATSFGRTSNDPPDLSSRAFPHVDTSILDLLTKRHVSWEMFSNGAPGAETLYGGTIATRWGRWPLSSIESFLVHAAKGTLPEVSFVDPTFEHSSTTGEDEHPPADVQLGQKFVSSLVHALFTSPDWPHSALFLTYDEHGGFYDHVPPPPACAPDANLPSDGKGNSAGWAFDRLGVRVPMMVISPFSKKGYVGHETYDHTSITRFLEAKFKLPALTGRDANAVPPMDMFDFSHPTFLVPPTLAQPVVDADALAWCRKYL